MNGILVLALTLAGCGSAAAAAHKAHVDLDCPEQTVKVTELTDNRYRAEGCDATRIYLCEAGECVRDGWYAGNARERGSRELGCSPDRLEIRWIQEEQYRVEGCGKGITYACWDERCMPRTSASPAP